MIDGYWVLIMLMSFLWIQGVNCLFSEGHLFGKVGDWLHEHVSEYLYKPTIGCPMCMSSIHGTLWYLLLINRDWFLWPAFCVCLCGLNFVISKLSSKERIIIDE